jgi:predicted metallopeptidase
VATPQDQKTGTQQYPPLVLRWEHPARPLPVRPIQGAAPRAVSLPSLSPPPWVPTGTEQTAFDFVGHVRQLCADIAARCPDLAHIDVTRLLFGVTQARNGHIHGLQARLTPLRFRNGELRRRRRATLYQLQRYFVDDREILYLITFCLPRFLDQDFDEKFITLFHELYHISPQFDGDLRRHEGRCSIHSRSQKKYDDLMARLAREYLASGPDPALYAFLRLDFAQLRQRHGSVVGVMVPRPKIIPVPG